MNYGYDTVVHRRRYIRDMTTKIKAELAVNDRDFIIDLIDYALSIELSRTLKTAEPTQDGFVEVLLGEYDLEELIGNLCGEANHNKNQHVSQRASDVADLLECYETQLKRKTIPS